MFIACIAVFASACDQKPEPREASQSEKTAVKEIVGQIKALSQLATAPASAENLKAAISFEPYQSLISPLRRGSLRSGALPPPPECATVNMNMATFTNCEVEGHNVNGTVTKDGDHVTADVTDTFTLAGEMGTATVDADVTFTMTSIDGSINVSAMATGAQGESSVTAGVTFDNVVLDSMLCPTDGTLTISGDATVRGTAAPKLTITITFGPACGDVQKS